MPKLKDKDRERFEQDIKGMQAAIGSFFRATERLDCTEKLENDSQSTALIGLHGKDSTDLIDAVEDADTDTMYNLVVQGVPVNGFDEDGYSPLIMAACCGHVKIAHLLLEMGARVNMAGINRSTPLHVAVQANFPEISDLILDCRPNLYKTMAGGKCPLFLAVQEGHRWAVTDLIESKADVDQISDEGRTPLHIAVELERGRIVRSLLEASAKVNAVDKQGVTPLLLATHKGNCDIITALLEHGAELDTGPVMGNIQVARSTGNDRYFTPLLLAALEGAVPAATQLVEAGADVNSSVLGITPLLCACHSSNDKLIGLFVNSGEVKKAKAWSAASVMVTLHDRDDERLDNL